MNQLFYLIISSAKISTGKTYVRYFNLVNHKSTPNHVIID